MIRPKRKKFTYRALAVAFKKISRFLPFFLTLSPFSRLLPALENCWTNFKIVPTLQMWHALNHTFLCPATFCKQCIKGI